MHSALPKLFPAASHPNGRRKLTRIVGWFAFFCMMGTGSTPAGAQWYGQLGYNALEQDRTFYFRADWQMGANRSISDIDWVTELMQSSSYSGLDLRIGIQSSTRQEWARLLNFPQYGLGFTTLNFHDELVEAMTGRPQALYIFGDFPLLAGNKWRVNLDLAGGVVFNLRTYHPELNPFNDMLGSQLCVYFDFGMGGQMRLTRSLDLSAGINLIHFSNGRIRTPNKGMNLMGVKLGVVHYFRRGAAYRQPLPLDIRTTASVPRSSSPSFPEHHTFFWNVSLAAGINSTNRGTLLDRRPDFIGPNYLIAALLVERVWKYSGIAALGLGANLHYDASLGEEYPETGGAFGQKTTFGIALGHEFFIHKFGIITQLGYKPFMGAAMKAARGRCYLRGGARWRFSDQWWCYAALKTMNRPVADFIEWGVGVSL